MSEPMKTIDLPPEAKLAMLMEQVARMQAQQDRLDEKMAVTYRESVDRVRKRHDALAELVDAAKRLLALES
jgi:hypothetical protein